MVCRGTVKGGVIVPDEAQQLPEGARVTIQVEEVPEEVKSLREMLLSVAGTAEGAPEDAARNFRHYLYGQPRR